MVLIKYEDARKVLWEESCLMSDEISELLDSVPIVDAVEVVRCKDCGHSYEDLSGLTCSFGPCLECVVEPDFYCAFGEQKGGTE